MHSLAGLQDKKSKQMHKPTMFQQPKNVTAARDMAGEKICMLVRAVIQVSGLYEKWRVRAVVEYP